MHALYGCAHTHTHTEEGKTVERVGGGGWMEAEGEVSDTCISARKGGAMHTRRKTSSRLSVCTLYLVFIPAASSELVIREL